MVKGTWPTCAKYTLIFFNFLFLVTGMAGVVIGILILVDKPLLNNFANIDSGGTGVMTSGAYAILVGSSIIVLFAIFGCCGACRESKCLLGVYIGLLSLILIVQIAAGALAANFRTQADKEVKGWLLEQVKTQYDGRGDTNLQFGKSLDFAMIEFDCCGISNYSDFKIMAEKWTERVSRIIPIACCKLDKQKFYAINVFVVNDLTCTTAPTYKNSNIARPCYDTIRDHLLTQAMYIIIIAFIIVALEILGIVFACFLIRTIRDDKV
ncbi:tetraspanin-8-like [Haliotis rufescens]|uniref:tetraspanin-8-like n=1 Tax=Haliotis rufescens TaxID=6454 RepID=UPI00201E7F8F|nr:tetraspanin-8-like [Haliotis rufescens]